MTTTPLLLTTVLLLELHHRSTQLKCYSCSFSFNELYDLDHRSKPTKFHIDIIYSVNEKRKKLIENNGSYFVDAWCANESLVLFDTDETAKSCAPWEKFCVTAVNTINKAFTSVSRGCGERCSELCESVGYGHDQVAVDGEGGGQEDSSRLQELGKPDVEDRQPAQRSAARDRLIRAVHFVAELAELEFVAPALNCWWKLAVDRHGMQPSANI
ncbi:unnamed protein product [Heligmosomoides polygyrus]|uniref:Toxin_TOLIP domain-containing protein n=1 Tax=Heligmosomoides polygyrus TaxID=6339 RepID=A0A183G170_HELPZ|nr:unnamed protein product [Heligmosomoides polygyrus]